MRDQLPAGSRIFKHLGLVYSSTRALSIWTRCEKKIVDILWRCTRISNYTIRRAWIHIFYSFLQCSDAWKFWKFEPSESGPKLMRLASRLFKDVKRDLISATYSCWSKCSASDVTTACASRCSFGHPTSVPLINYLIIKHYNRESETNLLAKDPWRSPASPASRLYFLERLVQNH